VKYVIIVGFKDVSKLVQLYPTVDDIELYVGGMLEMKAKDALVGPTFQCLIAEAFYRYKFGDRFFYEHSGHLPSEFTKGISAYEQVYYNFKLQNCMNL
jgi:peroxidase